MLTIAYITSRADPRFEWFAASLSREMRDAAIDGSRLQVIVVDSLAPRKLEAPFPFEHRSPKPTVWQGRHRLTRRDYFAPSNTRNTAFALARHEHIAFVDDLSVLLPGWLKAHVHAAANKYVLAGTTSRYFDVVCDSAGDYRHGMPSPDIRLDHGRDSRLKSLPEGDGIHRCLASEWLYGGTFSVPLKTALTVNGYDEIYNGGALYDDGDFGIRVGRTGIDMMITRTCGTIEDELGHTENSAIRIDNGSHNGNVLIDQLRRDSNRIWTVGNVFNLKELRDRTLAGNPFPIPTEPSTHWVDGQPLSGM